MLKLMLGCCKVYISETRNWAAPESIEKATKLYQWVAIVNKFEDEAYNQFPPGTFSSSTEGQGVYWKIYNLLYTGAQAALVAAYPVLQDEESNVFSRPETWSR
ncbi:hypothetical protein C5167_003878 [Papaver somniferum]|uniref:Uncharacterized protein n=1 Tax=Papaver somniferum TaxID=3469 RepID=A0A4Y7KV88_PAPSO|nr:hypothetical protein C5167_003878 [Papaver somniferum]